MEVSIKPSKNNKKKYTAIFYENGKKKKTTHFGAGGMSDFTKHGDEDRKKRYLDRHRKNENWDKYIIYL